MIWGLRVSDIIDFDGVTKLDIDPDKVLAGAKENLNSVIVIGWDKEDNLYTASSSSSIGELLYLLEVAKKELLR